MLGQNGFQFVLLLFAYSLFVLYIHIMHAGLNAGMRALENIVRQSFIWPSTAV